MKTCREQLSSWKDQINAGKYESVSNEYKSCISENHWSLNDEIYAASYCLITLNAEAHQILKLNSTNSESALVFFKAAKVFCESTAKSWDLISTDFPAAVFYIFKYLLDQNCFHECLYVANQAFEYQKKCPINADSKNQPNVLYSILTHLFVAAEKLQLTKDNYHILGDLFMFLSSNVIFGANPSKLTSLLKYFSSFLLKCAKSPLDDYLSHCSNILNNLARSACQKNDLAESTFMEIIRSLVYDICELSLTKESKQLILDCLNTFEESCKTPPTCISFCRNIYRIAVCFPEDNSCLSDVVINADYELRMLISNKSPSLTNAVYFSSLIVIKMRNWDSEKCIFKTNCAVQLFELLYILAEQTFDIDLNEFCQKGGLPRKDIRASAYLCCFLLCFAETIENLNITSPELYTYISKSVILCRKCIQNGRDLDEKKRQQMYYFIGVACVNLHRRLTEYERHDLYIELCSTVCPAFMTIDAKDLATTNLQLCLEKLITKMCTSYRSFGYSKGALIASVVWSLILPSRASKFMEIFGKLKQKLYTSNDQEENQLHLLNSVGLLKHEGNKWPQESLNQADFVGLLQAELEQYKKFNICSVKLLQGIIFVSRQLKPSVYQKALLYMTIGEVLTNSDSSECLDFIKLFLKSIEGLIRLLHKCAASPLENEITTWHALLGDMLYVKFRIALLIHRSENECELKSLSSFKKPVPAEPGMEPNFKEEGIITLTNFVCLSAQRKLTKLLDAAVENWRVGLQNKSKLDLSHLKDAALIYRLYCDTMKEIDAWELLYLAATFINDPSMAVYAYANLLAIPWKMNAEWRKNVENNLLPQVPENIHLFYRLNYLDRRMISGFDKSDEETLLSMPIDEFTKHHLLPNYYLLMSRCRQHNLVEFPKSPLIMSFIAYSTLMYRIKSKKWNSLGECCEIQCLLFDVVLFLVSSNVQVYQVVEAKGYLKEPINLILKLSLPLRTCRFLNISIRIDALTCALDECYLKLQDVCDILELKCDKQALLCKPTQPAPVLSPVMDSDLRSDGGGRRIEFPTAHMHIAPRWKFQLPDFLNHDRECVCDLCTSHEYSRLLCEVTTFFGVYYRLAGRGTDAVEFFEGLIRMHDIFSERFSRMHRPLHFVFLEIKTFAMFEYANYWAMVEDFDAALSFNSMALKSARDHNFVMKHDCVEQYWAILSARSLKAEKEISRKDEEVAAKSNRIRFPHASAVLKSTTTVELRTPATRKTVSAAPAQKRQQQPPPPPSSLPPVYVDEDDDDDYPKKEPTLPAEVTPYPRRSRRVLFDEFMSPTKVASAAALRTRRLKKLPQMSTPPDIVMQTPAAIQKRTKKFGERKNLFENEKNSTANPPEAAAKGGALRERKTRIPRKGTENIVPKK